MAAKLPRCTIFVTLCLLLAGCASPGQMSRDYGHITNTFNINTTYGPNGGVMVKATDPAQNVTPTATSSDSSSVGATGTGNVVINLEQASTRNQTPVAFGVNATVPMGGATPAPVSATAPGYGK